MSYIKTVVLAAVLWALSMFAHANPAHPSAVTIPSYTTNLTFTMLRPNVYSLVGAVGENDCNKIKSLLPKDGEAFTVILESPGGSLFEGMCLAETLKDLDVTTVVANLPLINLEGELVYIPGSYTKASNALAAKGEDRVVICASACSLLFLGGDERRLVGNVYLGIHAPRSDKPLPDPLKSEAQAYSLAAHLMGYLQRTLLVEDDDLRRLFILVPAKSIYYVQPRHFKKYPWLKDIATHYHDFHGYDSVPAKIN